MYELFLNVKRWIESIPEFVSHQVTEFCFLFGKGILLGLPAGGAISLSAECRSTLSGNIVSPASLSRLLLPKLVDRLRIPFFGILFGTGMRLGAVEFSSDDPPWFSSSPTLSPFTWVEGDGWDDAIAAANGQQLTPSILCGHNNPKYHPSTAGNN
jgi:hypothetical protein